MTEPVLDHVVLDVHDQMDAWASRYRELGFTLTPRGHHTLGSINHLAMFREDYLELLGWPAEQSAARPELQAFARGLNGLVFKTADAEATAARLEAAGVAGGPVRSFSRPVALPTGAQDARFRTVGVAAEAVRFGRMYFCEHLTPELVWRPEWLSHANGTDGIHSVVIESRAPAETAELFRLVFGEGSVRERGADFVLQAGRGAVIITGGAADHMRVLRLLARGREGHVPAEEAGGVGLEFVRLEFVGADHA